MAPFPDFAWAVGEEGSDPIVLRDGAPYRQDQFVQSGHDRRVEADLADIAALGADVVRYGTPWRLAEPEPGVYDWSRWDRALQACADAGVEPVVEFVHFGLPDHHPGFADPAWVGGLGRYVDAFLARYPEPRWFTPVNEPGITALMSARFGLWNERLASTADHARALANVVDANLDALARIHADRDALWVGAEGFDMPVATTREAGDEVATRRALGWLVWDLHFGRTPAPEMDGYLDPVDDTVLERIHTVAASVATPGRLIAGLDVYPASITAVGGPTPEWSVTDLAAIAVAEIERWHDRYGHPFWIAETSNLTLDVDQQIPWLDALTTGLAGLRAAGRPARGLCWYSRGDQFDWQTALTEPIGAVTEVGLFDADRRPRPVATRFAELARAGLPMV